LLKSLEELLVQLIVGGGRRRQRRRGAEGDYDRRQQVRLSHLSPL
jgi:hypothetical protein